MQIRKQLVYGSALALAIAAAPVQARVGVDEEAAGPGRSRGSVEAPPSEGGSETTAGYDEKEGGFVLRSSDGENKLVVGGRLQARIDTIGWDDTRDREDTKTFQLRRARLYFLGHLMGSANSYYVQIGDDTSDLYYTADGFDGNSGFTVYDAWFKHEFLETFALKMGQFKVPYSRQFLTSSGKMQFPDRSLATSALLLADTGFDLRDVGVEASGGFHGGKFQYAAAIVNGEGSGITNADDKFGYYGRLSFNPTGDYGYSEGDLDGSETLASTFGVAVHRQDITGLDDADITRLNLDGGIKKNGFSLQAELYMLRVSQGDHDDVNPSGFYLQGGYFFSPSKLEVVGRVSRVNQDTEGIDDDVSEYAAGLNYYMMGQRLKWQAAYTMYDDQRIDGNDNRFTAAAQVWF